MTDPILQKKKAPTQPKTAANPLTAANSAIRHSELQAAVSAAVVREAGGPGHVRPQRCAGRGEDAPCRGAKSEGGCLGQSRPVEHENPDGLEAIWDLLFQVKRTIQTMFKTFREVQPPNSC